jgi:hypothetical protein
LKITLRWLPAATAGVLLGAGCGEGSGSFQRPDDPPVMDAASEKPIEIVPVGPALAGLHVVGNRIQTADGLDVVLHGVNRSGTEYQCSKNAGFFDGPSDAQSIKAMADWKVNAVRVPLNEACWLGINGVTPEVGGENYKKAIGDYVKLLQAFHMVPILDLHWIGPGDAPADRLQPMPDADHAPAFWADVATTFKDSSDVILELFNEPFPGSTKTSSNEDNDQAWQCWRDGCESIQYQANRDAGLLTYQAVGMQALVDAVRATGARNVILLGGVQYSNALTQWLSYKPTDPTNNLAAVWHVYNYNRCADVTCWDTAPAEVAAQYPIVSTELGENDCGGSFITSLIDWLDAHRSGYLAWAWDAYGQCVPFSSWQQPGQPYSLIADYQTGKPNGEYGQTFHDRLARF